MVNGPAATVLESDIIVTNGYLNIIDKVKLMIYSFDYFRLFIIATGCPSERRPQEDG